MADGYKFTITITEKSYSVDNNTSEVSVNIKCNRPSGATGSWGSIASTLTVVADGQSQKKTISSYDFRKYSQLDMGTFTYTIPHNDDGSKTVYVSATWDVDNHTLNSGNGVSGSGSKTLTTIPRGTIRVRSGGSWRKGQAYVKVGGSWRKAKGVYVKVGGSWRRST